MIGCDVTDDDAIHGDGNGDQGRIDQGETRYAPDAEGLEGHEQDGGELMQESDGAKFHGVFILSFGAVNLLAGRRSRLDARCCRRGDQGRGAGVGGRHGESFRLRVGCRES